jgi:hypothetical protein
MAIVALENVPVTLAAVKTVKVDPTVGVKPLASVTVRVPAKLTVPLTCNWLYCVPTVVPPMKELMAALDSCV